MIKMYSLNALRVTDHLMHQKRMKASDGGHLILFSTSLLIVMKDVVSDVLIRRPDQQTTVSLHVPSPAAPHGHGQEKQH